MASSERFSRSAQAVCDDCYGRVSKTAETCPHCGAPVNESEFSDSGYVQLPKKRKVKKQNAESKKGRGKDTSSQSASIQIAFAILAIAVLLVVAIGSVLWLRPNETKRLPSISVANVDKALFLPAYNAMQDPIKLDSELKTLGSAIKTEDERKLFGLFQAVTESRADAALITQYSHLLSQLRGMRTPKNAKGASQQDDRFNALVDKIAEIHGNGQIITECASNTHARTIAQIRQYAIKELAEKHGVRVKSVDGFRVVDRETLKERISKKSEAAKKQIESVMGQQ